MSERPQEKPAAGRRYRMTRRKDSRRVIVYLVILFSAALFLLLMAMLMQHRANQATIDDLNESITSIHSLQNLVEVNQDLTEENADLRDRVEQAEADLETAKDELEAAQKSLQAMDYLRRIQMFYAQGSYSSARIVLEAMEAEGLENWLPTDTHYQNSNSTVRSPAEEYARIRDALY